MVYGLYKGRALIETSKDILKLYMQVYTTENATGPITPAAIEKLMAAKGYRVHPLAVVKLPTRKVNVPSFDQLLRKAS